MNNVSLTAEDIAQLNNISRQRDPDVFLGDKLVAVLAGTVDFEAGTPTNAKKAESVLTLDTQPTVGDTMTIGTKQFTFVATADDDGEIAIGADLAAAEVNIVAAMKGTDGHNTVHPTVDVSDFSGDAALFQAKTAGVAGNSIATLETFTAPNNIFDDVTLLLGIDGEVGKQGNIMFDGDYLYVCSADNTISGANWGRVALDYDFN